MSAAPAGGFFTTGPPGKLGIFKLPAFLYLSRDAFGQGGPVSQRLGVGTRTQRWK